MGGAPGLRLPSPVMFAPSRPPAPRPCASCPYRCDVPSGVWHAEEYARLPGYDRPTGEQPTGLFHCHQNGRDDPAGMRVCAGWAACHNRQPAGYDLLSLRLAESLGLLDEATADAVWDYTTDVPVFTSGAQAAAHGMAAIDAPPPAARTVQGKIVRRRTDITPPCDAD